MNELLTRKQKKRKERNQVIYERYLELAKIEVLPGKTASANRIADYLTSEFKLSAVQIRLIIRTKRYEKNL